MNNKVEVASNTLPDIYRIFGKDLSLPNAYIYGTEYLRCDRTHYQDMYYFYWYHPDHLGSSSYITNLDGEINQHLEYLPFGEALVEEHLSSYNSPFKFNAKEFDAETGNYYYGARYYSQKYNLMLSVDPMYHLYPSFSPYAYVLQNPIKFTDPTGMFPVGGGKNPVLGKKRTTRVSGRQQTFHRLSNAAILTLNEGTGVNKEILRGIWVSIDQKVHDNSTGYKSGAITLGRYMFFTENYENESTRGWLELLGHEVKHSEQAKRKGPSGYLPEYLFLSGTTALKEGTLDKNKIHDNHPMEIWADNTESQFKTFLDSFNYQDDEGNRGTHILDVFNDDNLDDKQKVYYLKEMFNARKEEQYEDRNKG